MQLYEVEIKSKALLRDGKRGFVTYFRGGPKAAIAKNVRKMYPNFMKEEDDPVVNITPIVDEEYDKRKGKDYIEQNQEMISGKAHIMKPEDYENMGN